MVLSIKVPHFPAIGSGGMPPEAMTISYLIRLVTIRVTVGICLFSSLDTSLSYFFYGPIIAQSFRCTMKQFPIYN